ncbi:HNH endonuclease signature motif containing protein, partial [Georgenia subflava]
TLADKATTFHHPSLPEKIDATGEEIALRLAISKTEARDLVTVGHGLTRAFTQTGAALAAGAIDFRKAAKIVTTLQHAPGPVAAEVEAEVLHQADGRTPSQLQGDLNKALIAVDPEDAQDRHARARAGRHVNHTKALPDGMASLYAVLPAEDCVTVDLALDAIATTAKAAGDTRTMSQLRADAMAAMARGTIHTGWTGPPPHHTTTTADAPKRNGPTGPGTSAPPAVSPTPPPTDDAAPSAPDSAVEQDPDASASTRCLSSGSAGAVGHPPGAEQTRQSARSGRTAAADRSGSGSEGTAVPTRPPEGRADDPPPGRPDEDGAVPPWWPFLQTGEPMRCGSPATTHTQIKVTVPLSVLLAGQNADRAGTGDGSSGDGGSGDGSSGEGGSGDGGSGDGSSASDGRKCTTDGTSTADHIGADDSGNAPNGHSCTCGATSATSSNGSGTGESGSGCGGLVDGRDRGDDPTTAAEPFDDPLPEVAVLHGYGPITGDVARALAVGGTWRRLVTDPVTGTVLDHGRTRYRPPEDLQEHVRLRDTTCVLPGCSVPAQRCQIDHTIPWSQGGHTADTNHGPLCTRDHTLKTVGAFTVVQPQPGIFEWTTPTGHVYRRETDGTITMLPARRTPPTADSPDDGPTRQRGEDPWNQHGSQADDDVPPF